MHPAGLWIHGIGVTSPLGDTARTTAAAVRAGLSRRMRGALTGRTGEPMVISSVPESALPPLAPELVDRPARHARLLRLATHALREACRDLPDDITVPLMLALPEPPARVELGVADSVLDDLRIQSGLPLAPELGALAIPGRAGPLLALADAYAATDDPATPAVLVGGVDSQLDHDTLVALDRDRRVLAAGARDGFAPGEGAGFLLVSRHRRLGASQARMFVTLAGVAEVDVRQLRGDALARAIADASRGCAAIHAVYAGLNGEYDGAREWQVAALRNRDALHEAVVTHPADCLGDPGAALAPTLLALAVVGLEQGVIPGPALVWAASEGPYRAAAVLHDFGDR